MDEACFRAHQYDLAYPDGIDRHYWNLARNAVIARALAGIEDGRPCALEVGCGRGFVVRYLREKGFDCRGVELADVSPAGGAEGIVRIRKAAGDLSAEERARYNTLLFLDVIEHIPDEVEFLKSISDAFPNASNMVITAPAREELWSNYDEFYGHCRRYDTASLSKVVHSAGWSVARISYFFHLLYLPALLLTRLKMGRATKVAPPVGYHALLHRLLSIACIADYHLLPRSLAGTSLICTAHRDV